ncbi:MAG: MBL fold metallo-hydrolase [Candidatus Bathyarchaeia archaeon]
MATKSKKLSAMIRLTPSVYFNPREAGASNNGIIERDHDVVFVDTSEWLSKTEQNLKFLTTKIGKPVRFLINTHYHPDHTFGNQLFTCDIIASHKAPEMFRQNEAELPKWLETEKDKEVLENLGKIKITYPNVLVKDKLRLEDSTPIIELTHLGGHTPDSLVVHVPDEHVIFTGDLIFQGSHPFLVGSNIDEWIAALEWLQKCGAKLFLPGHGNACGVTEVLLMREYLSKFKTSLRSLKSRGLSAKEIADNPDLLQLPTLDKPQRVQRNILHQYDKV